MTTSGFSAVAARVCWQWNPKRQKSKAGAHCARGAVEGNATVARESQKKAGDRYDGRKKRKLFVSFEGDWSF